jgi:hypothetical protein
MIELVNGIESGFRPEIWTERYCMKHRTRFVHNRPVLALG